MDAMSISIILLMLIILLLIVMVYDIASKPYVDEYRPVTIKKLVWFVRSCRVCRPRRRYDLYDFGVDPFKCGIKQYSELQVDIKHNISNRLQIKTFIDVRGDLIQIYWDGTQVIEYVDQIVQSDGFVRDHGFCIAPGYWDRQFQIELQALIKREDHARSR